MSAPARLPRAPKGYRLVTRGKVRHGDRVKAPGFPWEWAEGLVGESVTDVRGPDFYCAPWTVARRVEKPRARRGRRSK